jgi:hypothetical protein
MQHYRRSNGDPVETKTGEATAGNIIVCMDDQIRIGSTDLETGST